MSRPSSLILILISGLIAFGCSGKGRALIVRSDPPDADVCIKGRAKSEYFTNTKNCVGTTPFEAEQVVVQTIDGDKEKVTFKDVESDKESFYVVVSKTGYVPQALTVPEWEHNVHLKQEGVASTPVPAAPAPVAAPTASAPAQEVGALRVTSEPIGALVYINDELKGNTPFSYEAPVGQVRVKLELEGYRTVEKILNVESKNPINLSFRLMGNSAAHPAPSQAAPAPSSAPAAKAAPNPAKPAPAQTQAIPNPTQAQ